MSKQAAERRLDDNEASAFLRAIRTSPRKLNLVAQMIRGKDAATACGSGTATGGVARNGFFALIASSAVIDDNHQFRWVACSGDAGTVTPHLDRSAPPAGRCVRSQNS